MIQLRGGYQADDPRLDRLPEPDLRNQDFPITAVVPARLQSRRWRLTQRLDQGREGQCVSYGFHHEACADPVRRKTPTQVMMRDRYWKMQRIDPWPGGEYPSATPQYAGTSVLAGAKVMQADGFFVEYRWGFTAEDVARAISHEGPCVLGLDWYTGMMRTDEQGYLSVTGRVVGGHAICARGVDVPHERFVLRNSWGLDFGINGDCFLRFDDLDRLLRDGGDACVPMVRR